MFGTKEYMSPSIFALIASGYLDSAIDFFRQKGLLTAESAVRWERLSASVMIYVVALDISADPDSMCSTIFNLQALTVKEDVDQWALGIQM